MWKRIPFFPSWTANVEVEIGICELELPLPCAHEEEENVMKELWSRRDEEFVVEAQILCHGYAVHKVPVSSRCPLVYDESRVAVVWGELLRFPVKVRELSIDATLAIKILGQDGSCVASTSIALFDRRGALKQGLVKALVQDITICGDEEYEKTFATTDYLFQADKVREILVEQRRRQLDAEQTKTHKNAVITASGTKQQKRDAWNSGHAEARGYQPKTPRLAAADNSRGGSSQRGLQWLDELSLNRAEYVRSVLGTRREWLHSVYASPSERRMLGQAFLVLELARFEHPVLFEEKAYTGAPVLAPLVTPRIDDDLTKVSEVKAKMKRSISGTPHLLLEKQTEHPMPAFTAESPGFSDRGPTFSSSTAEKKVIGVEESNDLASSVDSEEEEEFIDEAPVYDYEDNLVSNPIEDKYRALARDATRALVDRELKPDVDEARALARIIGSPSDELAPLDRELVWKFRFTLTANPQALPKFLLSVDWRAEAEVAQVQQLLAEWRRKGAIDIAHALKLLGPEKAFQRDVVRSFAVDALRKASDQELIAYLLQLVQALRYSIATQADDFTNDSTTAVADTSIATQDTNDDSTLTSAKKKKKKRRISRRSRETKSHDVLSHETANVLDEGFDATETVDAESGDENDENESPLAAFLSERACVSLAVANFVWWYLKVGADDTSDEAACYAYRVFRASFVQTLAEEAPHFYTTLKAQEQVVASILSAQARAREVKGRKDHKQERLRVLLADLRFPDMVRDHGVPAPLDPNVLVCGLADGPKTQPKMYRSAMYPALVALERLSDEATISSSQATSVISTPLTDGDSQALSANERPLVVDRLFAGLRRSTTGGTNEENNTEQIPNDTPKSDGSRSSFFLDGVVGTITTAAFGTDSPNRKSSIDDEIQAQALTIGSSGGGNDISHTGTSSESASHAAPLKSSSILSKKKTIPCHCKKW
uniref:Phosphatidylinositol 3-kinase n=1 Tax=Aureoumbra lagunensis TaxID=44058 RepID=A0A7S3K483_9STRA